LVLRILKEGEPARFVCERCSFVFYLDPKVAVGAIVWIDGKILLGRRGIEPAYGKWVFPGGFVDRGETVEEAVVRETREEVNVHVAVRRLLNVYSYPNRPVIIIVYEVEMLGGDPKAGDETLEVGIFAPEEIPWEDLAFPSTRDALRDLIEGPRSGSFPQER